MARNGTLALASALGVGLAATGCGASSLGGGSTPTATVKAYLAAIGNGDGGTACKMMTSSLQTRALSSAHSQGIKAGDCPALFSQFKVHLSSRQRSEFLNAKIASVSQTSDTATVTVVGGSSQPTLVKNGGRWFINGGLGF
jgi:hypothetical protein